MLMKNPLCSGAYFKCRVKTVLTIRRCGVQGREKHSKPAGLFVRSAQKVGCQDCCLAYLRRTFERDKLVLRI